MHLRRDFQAQRIQPDEAGGVILVAGFGSGFHRGIQQTHIALFWQGQSQGRHQCAEPAANCDVKKRYFPISNTTTS